MSFLGWRSAMMLVGIFCTAVTMTACNTIGRSLAEWLFETSRAKPCISFDDLRAALDQELALKAKHGLLRSGGREGLVIGVLQHGERRIFTYGGAQPDSIFEIGSITKTFTGVILAQMVLQGEVTLTQPVRELLPADFASEPNGTEITLLDLADQHSGLPRDPDNLEPANPSNPYADYGAQKLSQFLKKHGLTKPANAGSQYSNVGFGLLGYALARRAGISYEQLVQHEVTAPLGMHDTVITLSPGQPQRLIQGYDAAFNPAPPWDFDATAGAGALRSTASDMLTYLDANLHPEKYAGRAPPGSPAATLPAAIVMSHEPRADAPEIGAKAGLGWFMKPGSPHWIDHNGGTAGYGSFTRFCPEQDWGFIVLYNHSSPDPRFVDMVGLNITQLLSGYPAIPIDLIPYSH